jgi:hypothetical protein
MHEENAVWVGSVHTHILLPRLSTGDIISGNSSRLGSDLYTQDVDSAAADKISAASMLITVNTKVTNYASRTTGNGQNFASLAKYRNTIKSSKHISKRRHTLHSFEATRDGSIILELFLRLISFGKACSLVDKYQNFGKTCFRRSSYPENKCNKFSKTLVLT